MRLKVEQVAEKPAATIKVPYDRSLPRITRRGIKLTLTYIVLCVAAFFFILPFIWMISGAFKVPSQILTYPPTFIPHPVSLQNFSYVWQSIPLLRYFWNSVVIAV